MLLWEEICKKHQLHPFFVCQIFTFMSWILEAESNFDIEHLEKYKNPIPIPVNLENLENFTPEEWKRYEKYLRKKLNNPNRTYWRLTDEIRYEQVKKKYIALIAKKEEATWRNFLTILKTEQPQLDTATFTQDCKQDLLENPDPLLEKLLNEYQTKKEKNHLF